MRNVQALSAAIDAGQIHYVLSGYFGGFSTQDDKADLVADFYASMDGSGSPLGSSATIGDVSAADRGNQTGLLPRSTTNTLPAGTRSIKVSLSLTRIFSGGSYNDGYADDLSLMLFGSRLYLPLIVR